MIFETSYRTMFEALEDVLRAKGNRLAELRDILLLLEVYNRTVCILFFHTCKGNKSQRSEEHTSELQSPS